MNNTAQRLAELRQRAEENRATVAAYQEKMDDWQANATATEELDELAELEAAAAAPVYRVTVGNIGEVYAGNSQTEARATFSTYKAQSLANEGRAAAEPVTLWEHGHPVRELVPVVYDLELTDTYAGEANYSWVKRATLVYATEPTDRALVLAAKRALGLTGIKCTREDWPDTGATIQLDPRGYSLRAFITRRDV